MVTRRAKPDPWARQRLELKEMLAPEQLHYQRLGVTHRGMKLFPNTLTEGRNAIARRAHPDRFAAADTELQVLAHDVTSAANVAYETLADDKLHRRYRAVLMSTHRGCPDCKGEGEVLRKQGFKGGKWVLCNACEGSGVVEK